jgi:hypothetical protein
VDSSILLAACTASVLTILAAGSLLFIYRRQSDSRVEVNASLERIREMGELTAMTAYIKEVVTMKTAKDSAISTTGKIILICAFDIEFRYDLRRIRITRDVSGAVTIILPPHHVKSIPKKTEFYDERKAAYFGVFSKDFDVDERNKLLNEASAEAVRQAGVLQGDLQDKVRSSAKATLTALAHAFGTPDVHFSFEDSESVVRQITDQLERKAA